VTVRDRTPAGSRTVVREPLLLARSANARAAPPDRPPADAVLQGLPARRLSSSRLHLAFQRRLVTTSPAISGRAALVLCEHPPAHHRRRQGIGPPPLHAGGVCTPRWRVPLGQPRRRLSPCTCPASWPGHPSSLSTASASAYTTTWTGCRRSSSPCSRLPASAVKPGRTSPRLGRRPAPRRRRHRRARLVTYYGVVLRHPDLKRSAWCAAAAPPRNR